jgi:RNA polymerase sigma factor (sigma-70 family)
MMRQFMRWEEGSDHELIGRIARRDGEAFSVFYRRYLPRVLGFLVRETRDRDVAADLTAEVFAGVLLGAERYQPQAPDASAWVFSIARHKLLSSRRRRRVEDRARRELGYEPVLLEDGDVEAVDELVGDRGVLDGLVDQLPPHERFAVLERVVKGRAYRELAGDLRCSEMVVRKRVSRGLARLRKGLAEQ